MTPTPLPETPTRPAARVVVPALLGVIGALVAFAGSWIVSVWTDEAASISAADRSLPQLLHLVERIDGVHALYYLLLHAWTAVAGFSPIALRLPSAVAIGVAVVGVHRLATVLDLGRLAVPAAVVAIALPRLTWAGVEARSFGPSAAVAVWATVLLVVVVRHGSGDRRGARWRLVVYGALVAVGIALNIYLALLVVAHAVTLVLLRWTPLGSPSRPTTRALVGWLVAAAAASIAASPVVLLAASQRGQLGDIGLGTATMLRQVVVNQWFLGQTPTPVSGSDGGHSLWAIAGLVLAVLGWAAAVAAVVGVVHAAAVRPRDDRSPADRESHGAALAVVVPWLAVPTLVVVAWSIGVSPLYNARYFTFTAPGMALLVALGIGQAARLVPERRRTALAVAAVAAIAVVCVPIYVSQRTPTGKSGTDWSLASDYVQGHAHQGDGVYFAPLDPGGARVVERTTRNVEAAYPRAFDGLVDVTILRTGAQTDTLRGTSRSLATSTARLRSVSRLWVVRRDDARPADIARDAGVLAKAGFVKRPGWTGPMDDVTLWVRAD